MENKIELKMRKKYIFMLIVSFLIAILIFSYFFINNNSTTTKLICILMNALALYGIFDMKSAINDKRVILQIDSDGFHCNGTIHWSDIKSIKVINKKVIPKNFLINRYSFENKKRLKLL